MGVDFGVNWATDVEVIYIVFKAIVVSGSMKKKIMINFVILRSLKVIIRLFANCDLHTDNKVAILFIRYYSIECDSITKLYIC